MGQSFGLSSVPLEFSKIQSLGESCHILTDVVQLFLKTLDLVVIPVSFGLSSVPLEFSKHQLPDNLFNLLVILFCNFLGSKDLAFKMFNLLTSCLKSRLNLCSSIL